MLIWPLVLDGVLSCNIPEGVELTFIAAIGSHKMIKFAVVLVGVKLCVGVELPPEQG